MVQYCSFRTFRGLNGWGTQFRFFCSRKCRFWESSSRKSCVLQFVLMRAIIFRRTSKPIGQTRGFLSNGSNLQALYASNRSVAIA